MKSLQGRNQRHFDELMKRFDAIEARGWARATWGVVDDSYSIYSFERAAPPGRPVILLVGGIHGNEPAGVEAALRWMESDFPEHQEFGWLVIPCANPSGWVRHRRTNSLKRDLNRHFRDPECCEECAALRRATAQRRFLFSMDFHEDDEAPGFYVCEIRNHPPFAAEKLVEAVEPILPIWRAEYLDGRRAAADGCVRRFPVTTASLNRRKYWPLEFYLLQGHTEHTFCTETPVSFAMELRVTAHHAALQAACAFVQGNEESSKGQCS